MKTTTTQQLAGGEFILHNQEAATVFTRKILARTTNDESCGTGVYRPEVWPKKAQFEQKDYALTKTLMEKAGALGFGVAVPKRWEA